MTPGARLAAAIEVIDAVLAGSAAERALTNWARNSRFAGSKDRAAVRDHVFDVLRARRSLAAIGGAETGRGMVIGLLRRDGLPIADLMNGVGHAPAELSADEAAWQVPSMDAPTQYDMPDWLWPLWQDSLGSDAEVAALAGQGRAPAYLRVNTRRGDIVAAQAALASETIGTVPHSQVKNCLQITENPRKLALSGGYKDGLVELQDAASQMAIARLEIPAGARVLDYCAGGGGKALALADQFDCDVTAHDIDANRMQDIEPRATRAGVDIKVADISELIAGGYDLVICDAPCSGSGTWRRAPDAKWSISPEKLNKYNEMQSDVISKSADFVTQNGHLAYATCSVLDAENRAIVDAFCRANAGWRVVDEMKLIPGALSDGFYLAVLKRV